MNYDRLILNEEEQKKLLDIESLRKTKKTTKDSKMQNLTSKSDGLTAQEQLIAQSIITKSYNSIDLLSSISGLLKEEINDDQFEEMLSDIHR